MGKENIRWCRWECQKKSRYLKQSHFDKNQLFPTCVLFSLVCPLLEGNFHRDNENRT